MSKASDVFKEAQALHVILALGLQTEFCKLFLLCNL